MGSFDVFKLDGSLMYIVRTVGVGKDLPLKRRDFG
jgi:hypothetical protein